MRIDFNQVIKDIHGKPLRQPSSDAEDVKACETCGQSVDGEVDMDLRSICYNAILNNEQGMDGRTKVKRYDLAMRIKQCEEFLDLKLEEVTLLKKQVGKIMVPLVVGQVWPMLDPAEGEDSEKPKKSKKKRAKK